MRHPIEHHGTGLGHHRVARSPRSPEDGPAGGPWFALNGHNRTVQVRDRSRAARVEARRQADRANPNHVAASMPGTVIAVHVKAGASVESGAPLVTLEAMKMETVVRAPRAGTIAEVATTLKAAVQGGDLLAVLQ
ncbi:acetyl-CoA carboxylase [Myxococcus fulvus 124B02]|nr:acetyl-CoA carboxylase [Myxococcus fulvus 124B02]